jgi:pimeloyl-ACP methyl ester carboxylesterase
MTQPRRTGRPIKGISYNFEEPVLVETPEPLCVHHLPGSGKRLVLSLAGVGTSRKFSPRREFTGSASGGGQNHVLFISDSSRSWMNGPGVKDRIVDIVAQFRRQFEIDEVVALGNSMGGFAGLVLADVMPVDTVIAFSPQFSANPDVVPEETRWWFYRRQIQQWDFAEVGSLNHPGTNYFIFHADAPEEAVHWARFPKDKRIHHFILAGEDHNLVRTLQKRGLLRQVIETAIAGKPRAVRRALERGFLDRHMSALRREVYEETYPDRVPRLPTPGMGTPVETKGHDHDQI